MKKQILYLLLIGAWLLQSCHVQQAIYVSPFNAANNTYHPISPQSDSVKQELYASASFVTGNANDAGNDDVTMGNLGLSGAASFGPFQAYAGVSLSLGSYKVGKYDPQFNPSRQEINGKAGGKFFGGGVFSGGINCAFSLNDHFEWRMIGVEMSVAQEFGNYLHFRKGLSNTAADFTARSGSYATVGGYSEFIFKAKKNSGGFKLGYGTVISRSYRNLEYVINDFNFEYNYFFIGGHLTIKQWTAFMQYSFGQKAINFQAGLCYNLFKKTKRRE
jgi:hypothetical protein